ncbi:MAG: phosphopantetheine-binding protein [Syntrophobacteraceae bacterium]
MKVAPTEITQLMKECGINFDEDELGFDSILRESGLDSLDMANLLLALEEKYNIQIPDQTVASLVSINAISNYLSEVV